MNHWLALFLEFFSLIIWEIEPRDFGIPGDVHISIFLRKCFKVILLLC